MIFRSQFLSIPRLVSNQLRMMGSTNNKLIYFGPYEVTSQVFYNTPLCYTLVNHKPIVPGHVLVIPYRQAERLTDLTTAELTDLFTTVQKVQKMLASIYFKTSPEIPGKIEDGSFNVAIQDGKDSGQSVAHVHCHIIPRVKDNTEGDGIYDLLQGEEGNVGGGLWDLKIRPTIAKQFPKIHEEDRKVRSLEVMDAEAAFFREQMSLVEDDGLSK